MLTSVLFTQCTTEVGCRVQYVHNEIQPDIRVGIYFQHSFDVLFTHTIIDYSLYPEKYYEGEPQAMTLGGSFLVDMLHGNKDRAFWFREGHCSECYADRECDFPAAKDFFRVQYGGRISYALLYHHLNDRVIRSKGIEVVALARWTGMIFSPFWLGNFGLGAGMGGGVEIIPASTNCLNPNHTMVSPIIEGDIYLQLPTYLFWIIMEVIGDIFKR